MPRSPTQEAMPVWSAAAEGEDRRRRFAAACGVAHGVGWTARPRGLKAPSPLRSAGALQNAYRPVH